MSSIRKFFQPILNGVSRTLYGERPFKPRHVMVSVMPCLLKPRNVKPPIGLATSFAEMQRSVVRSRKRLEMKRKRTLALRRLLKNLHLYDLKFKVSPNVAKDKALLVFHPYHKLPSKAARVKRFEEEQSKGKKHTIMDLIWATVIICGLIKQSSKLASWASHVYPEYFSEKKGEGWKDDRERLLGVAQEK